MTLYFENPVNFPESGAISLNGAWHRSAALLAVSSFSQERGGFVTVFDQVGEPVRDVNYPVHRSFQVTALAWHPEQTLLATGWENGEFKVWNGHGKDFINVGGPHRAPITLIEFSEKGSRLVSSDSAGSLVGWKIDAKGSCIMSFHLDLKEVISHLTFRLTIRNQPDYFDVENLAKAAVNGDEHALDIFSNWRPKTTARKFRPHDGSQDNQNFFVGTQNGSIYYVNAAGSCAEVLNTEGVPLSYVVHHPTKDALVVMMEGLTVGHFAVDHQGHLSEVSKVKMSGRVQARNIGGGQGLIWAGGSALAILTGDLTVRIWDIDTNDNYVLPTSLKLYTSDNDNRNSNSGRSSVSEIFTCLAYNRENRTLAAGTNIGRIYFWTKSAGLQTTTSSSSNINNNPEECWELNGVNSVSGTVKQLMWSSLRLLSVNCVTSVYIMKEQTICTAVSEKIWAVQKTSTQVLLESGPKSSRLLKVDNQISDMAINEDLAVFTNGRLISVYNIFWASGSGGNSNNNSFELNNARLIGSGKAVHQPDCEFSAKFSNTFLGDNEKILLHNRTVILLTPKTVILRGVNGAALYTITFSNSEGEPIGMDVTGRFLTIFSVEGVLKLYDMEESGGTEPKLMAPPRNLNGMCEDFGEVIQAKSNCSGTKIAMTLASSNLIPDGKLYIWDMKEDSMLLYDFHKYGYCDASANVGGGGGGDNSTTNGDGDAGDPKQTYDEICCGRIPLFLFWDASDPRLLGCDAKRVRLPPFHHQGKESAVINGTSATNGKSTSSLKNEDHLVITMFVSSENGIRIHDIRPIDVDAKLLGVVTPFLVLMSKLHVIREVMSDFSGLEGCDRDTRSAVLDFSFNLSLGNMDAAFKAIKLVQSLGVWTSLAKMCVKTRRLDVAGVCLGHVGNARAAMALRIAADDPTLPHEARLAVLAVHLGMLDEAEQLYVECERYDLLNKLLRSRNKMEEAQKLAESKDRIHLKNTEHAWAKSLEQAGDLKQAAIRYEKAHTQKFDVPRMLLDQQSSQVLETYMSQTKDPELLKWWGQYVESQGDMKNALKIYGAVGDLYSQVRVLCFLGEERRAAEVAKSGSDKAAFYHMARYYETTGRNDEAVDFFTRANAYGNAVRLCKQNRMSEELWNIGLVAVGGGSGREKLECARYFEEIGATDRAIVLYHRAGMLHKALDLAFRAQQFDTLQQIATDLTADSDPALVQKCADYFVTNEQYDKAVDLLAIAKKYKEAIEICIDRNVQLTEDLCEKLTPEKGGQVDEETRLVVLETLGESLMAQGAYHLATKKFTQAGDKVRAMRALLKSGDTDKIVFFAGVSRQRDIYIMAANYLQSLDWQNDPDVLRNIITFYSKGKAMDLLANFYVACAQVEIDEFKKYEKAFYALTEAQRCLAKIPNPKDGAQHQRAVEMVQQRSSTIKRFVDIRRLFERGDHQAGMAQCRQLLMTSSGQELEASVRRGDIYALMIQECVKMEDFVEARNCLNELKEMVSRQGGNTANTNPITYYLGRDILEALAKGLTIPVTALVPNIAAASSSANKLNLDDDDDEEFVEEAIEN